MSGGVCRPRLARSEDSPHKYSLQILTTRVDSTAHVTIYADRGTMVVTAKNRPARVYDITATSRRHLEAEEKRWRKVTLAVGELLQRI